MRRGLALIACAAGALAASVAVQAVPPPVIVNDAAIVGEDLPRSLEDFAFFRKRNGTDPAPRVVPYELNTPLYSDGAEKLRYIYLPEGAQIEADAEGLLQLPVGSAIIKTFAFGERFIETRVLLHRADGWLALPYIWNAEQTEATLALAGGRVAITTPAGEEISYRIPNKNQCKTCHSKHGEVIPIGPKARNLSHEWLSQMVETGHLSAMPEGADILPIWSRRNEIGKPHDAGMFARAYLDVNCAHCHQPGGSASNSGLDLRWEQDDPYAIGIGKPPVAAGRGAGGLLVSIAPGEPDRSIILHRMASVEPGVAMPELGRASVDEDAIEVMRRWIAEMGK